ncbi:MAG: ATP-binding protein [Abditibacteriales bacterium]|nr:ATP-binding protein [Abditibacteriales bacterium]MDW8366688.1 ATP-binding protein [Abditibacteriales bacterium]
MTIKARHHILTPACFDDLVGQMASQKAARPFTLDLSEVTFVDPFGLVGTTLLLWNLPPDLLPARIVLPTAKQGDYNLLPYLYRIGFFDAVQAAAMFEGEWEHLKSYQRWDRNLLLEMTRVRTVDDINAIMDKTASILEDLGYSAVGATQFCEVISELCSNIVLHSHAERDGLVVIQAYQRRNGERFVVLAIGDAGIGIRRSLAMNPRHGKALESDTLAIFRALQPGVSRLEEAGHGGGLTRVLQIVLRYTGRLDIRSGAGHVYIKGEDRRGHKFHVAPFPGTQIRIALPEQRLVRR